MFKTPAYLTAQLLSITEDAYLSQANLQVKHFNDLIQEGKSRDIWGQMGGNAGWFEFHHVKDSLALQAVTRRTDKIIAAAREVALSNVATLEDRVSQHLSETDTVTGHNLFINAGRIEGKVYGITKGQETFSIYVRMMWNFRYGENSANGVITQYAQFRSERQGARQEGKPLVTERQAAAEAAKAEREAAKEARRSALLEKFKKAPARLAKSARKDIEFWKGLRWTGEEWVKVTTSYRVDFFTKGQSELQWKYFNTMEAAIAVAHCMVVSGEYSVEAINPDTSPTE